MLRDMRHVYTTNLGRPTLGGLTTTEVITAVVYVHITLLLSLVCVLTRSISADLRGAVCGGLSSEQSSLLGAQGCQLPAGSQAAPWTLSSVWSSLPGARLSPRTLTGDLHLPWGDNLSQVQDSQ